MKTLSLICLASVFVVSCSNSPESKLDKQAIIQAYKDSITLDSLKKSKLVIKSKKVVPEKITSGIGSNTKVYSDREFNGILAFIDFHKHLVQSGRYAKLTKSMKSQLDEHLDDVTTTLNTMNQVNVSFSDSLYNEAYNNMNLEISKYESE